MSCLRTAIVIAAVNRVGAAGSVSALHPLIHALHLTCTPGKCSDLDRLKKFGGNQLSYAGGVVSCLMHSAQAAVVIAAVTRLGGAGSVSALHPLSCRLSSGISHARGGCRWLQPRGGFCFPCSLCARAEAGRPVPECQRCTTGTDGKPFQA